MGEYRLIIYKGKGWLVVVFVFACSFIANLLTNWITGNEQFWNNNKWPFCISLLAASILSFTVGYYLSSQESKIYIEKDSGKEIEIKPDHSLFFIRVTYWGPILLLIAIAVLLVDMQNK